MISNIYNNEIKDGLLDALMCDGSVAYCSEAMGLFNDSGDLTESSEFSLWNSLKKINQQSVASLIDSSFDQFKDKRSSASSNPKQLDLFYLTSILVSTGWNKNDDVFTPLDTWAARKTPEDKQFNLMHNEEDIIGHITGNYVIDPSGNIIPDSEPDYQEPPSDFNIATNSVIYTSWAKLELKQRIEKIIAEIKQGGKWFVSMECLFPAFDYALQDSKGQTRLIKREESSAFLTKHLRSYGGTGEYKGHKIGRVLRDLSFSGKGLVSKPANPKSIILTSNDESDIGENNMSVQANDQLSTELAEAKVMNEKMKKEQEEVKAQLATVQATITEKEEAIANYRKQVEELSSTLAQVQATMQELTLAKKQMEDEMMDMKKKQKMEKRKATLVDAGVEEVDLDTTLASFEPLQDEAFDLVVAVMKKKAKKEDKEETMPPGGYASDSTSEQTAIDTLEDVQEQETTTVASLNESSDQEEDLAKDFRSSASAWFEKNVLKTKKTNSK